MSNSLCPHRLEPTRLLCPWGFSRQKYWSGLPSATSAHPYGFSFWSVCRTIQEDSHTLPSKPGGASPSWILQSLPPTALVHSISECSSRDLLWHGVSSSPRLWIFVIIINLVHQVLGVINGVLLMELSQLPPQWGKMDIWLKQISISLEFLWS